jgi:hypothetical protein
MSFSQILLHYSSMLLAITWILLGFICTYTLLAPILENYGSKFNINRQELRKISILRKINIGASLLLSPLGPLTFLPMLWNLYRSNKQSKSTLPQQSLPPGVNALQRYTTSHVPTLWQWHKEGTLTPVSKLVDLSSEIDCVLLAMLACNTPKETVLIAPISQPLLEWYTNKPLDFFYSNPRFWKSLKETSPNLLPLISAATTNKREEFSSQIANTLLIS